MSHLEININQDEMDRCITQVAALKNEWISVPAGGVCIMVKSKGRSSDMMDRVIESVGGVAGAMDMLLEKTIQAFGSAKVKYEEVDSEIAASVKSK